MKRGIQILAGAVVVVALAAWLTTGAHRGWTKTQIEVKTLDEVTGIEGITYQKGFWPGVDFLGAGLIGAGVLAGVSFLFRSKSNPQHQQQTNKL
ncbi:MAG: hypothetical protein HOP33_05185 [Verrucomicrobia bacterium]|nr:hypothetical protein [Verrucomicrobiota bacterium]